MVTLLKNENILVRIDWELYVHDAFRQHGSGRQAWLFRELPEMTLPIAAVIIFNFSSRELLPETFLHNLVRNRALPHVIFGPPFHGISIVMIRALSGRGRRELLHLDIAPMDRQCCEL